VSTTAPAAGRAASDEPIDLRPFRRRPIVTEPLGYVAPLDGLRALAVIAVVLYHSHFPWITGGFLGVSAFFTLSGFLITSLLLREWAGSSTVDLRSFWNRRFRRLLPASWLTMGVVLVAGAVGIWNDDQLRAVRSDLPYSLLEIVNWHFIAADRSYGAEFTAPSPLAHFWSLAVEQQFYLLLPVLALGVLTLGSAVVSRRRLQRLVLVFVALAVVSAVLNGLLARSSIDRAYYGTDTRMAEMLIGSLLACATLRRLRLPVASRARSLVSLAGLAAAALTLWLWHQATLRSEWMYPWGLLLTALCTATIIYAAVQGGWLAKALSVPPLQWIGRISYGVYLLHWPVFLWLTPARVGWAPWPLFALRMAVTVALAVAMFHLLENPVRHGRRIRRPYGWLAALVAAALLLGGDMVVTRDLPPPSQLSLASSAQESTPTTIPPPPVRALLIGDEIAGSLGESLAAQSGWELTTASAATCGLTIGGWIRTAGGTVERDVDRCHGAHEQMVAAATAAQPDVVLAMPGMREAADRRMSAATEWGGPGTPVTDDFLRTDLGAMVDELAASGAEVVLVTVPYVRNTVAPEPQPVVMPVAEDQQPFAAAEAAQMQQSAPPAGFAENDDARIDRVNTILAEVAASRGVRVLDLAAQLRAQPGGALAPELRPDGVRIAPSAGPMLSEWMLPLLRDTTPPPAAAPSAAVVAADAPLPEAPPAGPRRVVAPGERMDVLVVGDSVGHNLGYGLELWSEAGAPARVTNSAQLGCPVARGGSYRFKGDVEYFGDNCEWSQRFPQLVSGYRPDVVLLGTGIWEIVDRRLAGDDRYRHIGDPAVDRYILSELLSAVDVLGADGATVVLVTQPHVRPGLEQGFQDLPESDPARMDRMNELQQEAAALRPGVVRVVDLRGWLQGQPGGEENTDVRPDGLHFTDAYVETVAEWLGPELRSIAEGN
jgi:peptidoglycan/LPS O-acetylase OafA/YrhL